MMLIHQVAPMGDSRQAQAVVVGLTMAVALGMAVFSKTTLPAPPTRIKEPRRRKVRFDGRISVKDAPEALAEEVCCPEILLGNLAQQISELMQDKELWELCEARERARRVSALRLKALMAENEEQSRHFHAGKGSGGLAVAGEHEELPEAFESVLNAAAEEILLSEIDYVVAKSVRCTRPGPNAQLLGSLQRRYREARRCMSPPPVLLEDFF